MCMSSKRGGGEKLNENEAKIHENWFYCGVDFPSILCTTTQESNTERVRVNAFGIYKK